MPFAFSLVGLVLGPPALTFVASLCYYCMLLLLRCADHISIKTSKAAPTYGDVLQYAFKVSGDSENFGNEITLPCGHAKTIAMPQCLYAG